ncbi:MAG: DNA mismatch repair endonuclease MutL [Candidatus Omnitrophota bacterium]
MNEKIILLSEDTIGKIAAGEVVERPASVVKELVENSLDAGADSIEVEIERSGQNLIRVADNGLGMGTDDIAMAFKRHATSKIKSIDDLESIITLGFRGEALASVAAVSQVDVITRKEGALAGTYAYIESGEVQKIRPAARDRGTTIEVRNLFYNVPARRKFLKRESTEMSEIVDVFSKLSLSHPNTGFKLTQNGKSLLDISPDLDILGRAGVILGEDASRDMIPILFAEEGVSVEGFVSAPSSTGKDRKGQIFFVNGRSVRSKSLSDALYVSYRSLLERGRFPRCVLFVTISPGKIDVNVHPAKIEIKFQEEGLVKGIVRAAIESGFNEIKISASGPENDLSRREDNVLSPGISGGGDEPSNLKETSGDQREFDYEISSASGKKYDRDNPGFLSQEDTEKRYSANRVFQLGRSYIVRILEDGLEIMDQHAAHERVLYEFFSKTFQGKPPQSQGLLFPVKVELSVTESVMMKQMIPGFGRLGFDIETFGERSFIVRAVPPVLGSRQIETIVRDIVSDMSGSGTLDLEYMEDLVKMVSCRAAVKAGDVLSVVEMENLILQLDRCALPFTCPHGRPTRIEISPKELEKRFRRI